MSFLDREIDLEWARMHGACLDGQRWAEANPGATIRDLADENSGWAGWYLTQVIRLDDWTAAQVLMETVSVTTEAEKVAAVFWLCDDRHAVRALSGWWGDDARVVRALADARWGLERMARALRHGWSDMDRVVQAMAVLAPSDQDFAYAVAVTCSTRMAIRTLGRLWLSEDRIYRAFTPYRDHRDVIREAIETAWHGHEHERPDNLQPLSIPAPVYL
jgi:hypothetical protein